MIIGTGMDLIEIERIAAAVEKPSFVERVFTAAEKEYCQGRGAQCAASFAARFAGKEALLKAFGTGLRGGTWRDVEILPDKSGKPQVFLRGYYAAVAEQLGVSEIYMSLTHTRQYAAAEAILWRRDNG